MLTLRALRFRILRRVATATWAPSRAVLGSLVLTPLALLIAADRMVRLIARHAAAAAAVVCLVLIGLGLHRLDMLENLLDPWIGGFAAAIGATVAAMVLADWVRNQAELARRQTDPRQAIAVRRFRLVCEQCGFVPGVWHAGFDRDMFGIGVELFLQRLLIWKHGRGYVVPLAACDFEAHGRNLWVSFTEPRHAEVPADAPARIRISCVGAARSARGWVRLLHRASGRDLHVLKHPA